MNRAALGRSANDSPHRTPRPNWARCPRFRDSTEPFVGGVRKWRVGPACTGCTRCCRRGFVEEARQPSISSTIHVSPHPTDLRSPLVGMWKLKPSPLPCPPRLLYGCVFLPQSMIKKGFLSTGYSENAVLCTAHSTC